jgi:PcrA/UvrD helicase-like protein
MDSVELTKKGEYNRIVSPEENAITRADFAGFWNNRRFIVLIDGIQHYAKQAAGRWEADETAYAARVQEDRLLRTQGWHVFRVGNLEIRSEARRNRVLQELREFIGFDELPPSQSAEQSISIIRPRVKVGTSTPTPAPSNSTASRPTQNKPVQPTETRPAMRTTPSSLAITKPRTVTFHTGQKVHHAIFGDGIVVNSKLVDNDEEVTVAFSGKGVKRLLVSFANLERLDEPEDLPF